MRRGDPGVGTLQAVFGLVRLARRRRGRRSRRARRAAGRLARRHRARRRALVADRVERRSPPPSPTTPCSRAPARRPTCTRRSVPDGAPALFAAWIATLRREAPRLGVTALRAFVGDVSEAAFRSLQHGARAETLLGEADRALLVDTLCAELPGTTDFVAARGMAWLLGALQPDDETARAAIERARDRFRDPEFQADCEAMLGGGVWPPPQHG